MSCTRLAVIALASTALAVSGCGNAAKHGVSDGSGKTTAEVATEASTTVGQKGKVLVQEELIAKANSICARINARRDGLDIKSARDYGRLLPSLAIYEESTAAELASLIPPPALEGPWRQMVADAKTLADDTAKVGKYAADHGSVVGANSVASAGTLAAHHFQKVASQNGIKECAQS